MPADVTSVHADLLGAGSNFARGGEALGDVAVTPGQTLTVTVGQRGSSSWGVPAFGGGGAGAGQCTGWCGAGGGGMSALWAGTPNVAANALLVAGGAGGNGGRGSGWDAGDGGGLVGNTYSGGGGTQSAGGAAGVYPGACAAGSGSQFQGGNGAVGYHGGGGGGGGWYGGGGGACGPSADLWGNGGGGGSSYLGGPGVTNASTTTGANAENQDGVVKLQWVEPAAVPMVQPAAGLAALAAAGGVLVWQRRRTAVN
ncbi:MULTISPECIES: glycine-rich protein [Amycolatopsis]|uniref:receptor protein-tyrosine kinase n=1 Tax=Amycolatopsis dongchuanensis TaxID=1070866 RepID=A0ABP9QMJ9_9PSEU